MNTVTIFKMTDIHDVTLSGTSNYLLEPWPLAVEDDGGKLYQLPEGYTLESNVDGQPTIYDNYGEPCSIFNHPPTHRPQLSSSSNKMPVLKLAA